MFIRAWILVASANLNQPVLPAFQFQEDCEQAKVIYLQDQQPSAAQCLEVKILK